MLCLNAVDPVVEFLTTYKFNTASVVVESILIKLRRILTSMPISVLQR